MELLRSRLGSFETSLEKAHGTIDLLNQDIQRRVALEEQWKREKNDLLVTLETVHRQPALSDTDHSPKYVFDISSLFLCSFPTPSMLPSTYRLDAHLEEVMRRANETMQFLDRVAEMASAKQQATGSSGPRSELLDLLMTQIKLNEQISCENVIVLQNLPELPTPMKSIEKGLAAQQAVANALISIVPKISDIWRTPDIAELVPSLVDSKMSHMDQESLKEVETLRETVLKMTEAESYLRNAPQDQEQKLAHSLLQSHIQQLRKIWDHEVKANETLRRILAEVRIKHDGSEKQLLAEFESAQRELQLATDKIASLCKNEEHQHQMIKERNAALVAAETQMSEIKHAIELMRRDWQTERADLLEKVEKFIREMDLIKADFSMKERAWSQTQSRLEEEVQHSRMAMEQMQKTVASRSLEAVKRLTDDFSAKEAQLRKQRDSYKEEVVSIQQKYHDAIRLHRNEIDQLLSEKNAIERSLKKTASGVTEVILDQLKQKHLEEKEQILGRFKSKIGEFEEIHRQQLQTIERLKMENGHLALQRESLLSNPVPVETSEVKRYRQWFRLWHDDSYSLQQEVGQLREALRRQKDRATNVVSSQEVRGNIITRSDPDSVCSCHELLFDGLIDDDTDQRKGTSSRTLPDAHVGSFHPSPQVS